MAVTLKSPEVFMLPDGRLDVSNTAAYVGVTEHTLAKWRSEGTGPTFLKLGRIFYFKDDLDMWIREAPYARSTAEARRHSVARDEEGENAKTR